MSKFTVQSVGARQQSWKTIPLTISSSSSTQLSQHRCWALLCVAWGILPALTVPARRVWSTFSCIVTPANPVFSQGKQCDAVQQSYQLFWKPRFLNSALRGSTTLLSSTEDMKVSSINGQNSVGVLLGLMVPFEGSSTETTHFCLSSWISFWMNEWWIEFLHWFSLPRTFLNIAPTWTQVDPKCVLVWK